MRGSVRDKSVDNGVLLVVLEMRGSVRDKLVDNGALLVFSSHMRLGAELDLEMADFLASHKASLETGNVSTVTLSIAQSLSEAVAGSAVRSSFEVVSDSTRS